MSVTSHLVEQASAIVAAYVENNSVRPSELPALIESVHSALASLGAAKQEPAPVLTPAAPIKKSVTPDYLISLEDGKRYRALKRHLTGLGMTPDQYRKKWGLPPDYPMVAASYSAQRSQLAKTLGLGQIRTKALAAKTAKNAPRKKA